MGLRISTNTTSLNAQRNLRESTHEQGKALDKLASGSRIVRAADDAAGLAISEKLKASIRGLGQAKRNASDGVSLVQTAEGGLNEIGNILIRLRELSIQAASDTIGPEERGFLDLEYQQLKDEITRISNVTTFNGRNLLNGTGGTMEFQVDIHNDPFNDRLKYIPENNSVTVEALQLEDTSVNGKEAARTNLVSLDKAIQKVNGDRAQLGALQNRLSSTIRNLANNIENLSAANSRIRDADVAVQTSELTKQNILNQAGVSVLAQANQKQMAALKLIG